jgi:hypothetical protein
MNPATAPASRGMDWLRQALRLLGRRPLSLVSAMLFGFLSLAILVLVPWAGPVLSAAAAPAVTLGMIASCRGADHGEIPNISHYAEGLRSADARRGLLMLGIVNAAVLVPLSWIVQLASHPPPAAAPGSPPVDLPLDPAVLALQFVLSLPVLMAMLLAPPLVAWRGLPPLKAMFFSFFACWRSRWALLVFFGAVVALGFLADLAVVALVGLATSDPRYAVIGAAPISLLQCGNFRMYLQLFPVEPAGSVEPVNPAS